MSVPAIKKIMNYLWGEGGPPPAGGDDEIDSR